MDPITMAIIAALPGLASGTLTSLVKDAYDGLKAVIRRKWGEAAPVNKAISAIEEDPASPAQAAVLDEKVKQANLSSDSDVMTALAKLVEQLKASSVGGAAIANIQFTQTGGTFVGVGAAQNANIGSVTVGAPARD